MSGTSQRRLREGRPSARYAPRPQRMRAAASTQATIDPTPGWRTTMAMADTTRGVDGTVSVNPMFARSGEVAAVPRHRLPDGPMDPTTAYQIVHDHLMLDGNARL